MGWWNGCTAPILFCVKKKLDEKHLFNLYKINMLNKLCITINNQLKEYFDVPFEIPQIPKSKLLGLWRTAPLAVSKVNLPADFLH